MTPLSSMKKAPKWSMGSREMWRKQHETSAPGPGAYKPPEDTVSSKYSKPARFVFGSSERDSIAGSSQRAPGPGAYKVTEGKSGYEFGFGKSQRPALSQTDPAVPGPGANTVNTTLGQSTPTWKMSQGERKTDLIPDSPGPAAYKPNNPFSGEQPKWGMGTSNRPPLSTTDPAVPAPGTYPFKSRLQEGPRCTMGARWRDSKAMTNAPGPAAYSLTSTVGEGPKSSMGTREIWVKQTLKQDSANPGPGAYALNSLDSVKTAQPRFKFGSSQRDGMAAKAVAPGPGNYTPRNPIVEGAPAFGFGKSQRPQLSQTDPSVPGPGNYAITGTVGGSQGTKVVMTPRRADPQSKSQAPGPAAYTIEKKEDNTPKWSFGTSNRPALSQCDPSVPAPGTYAYSKPLGSDAPKTTIGMRWKDDKKKEGGGGAGDLSQAWTQFGY